MKAAPRLLGQPRLVTEGNGNGNERNGGLGGNEPEAPSSTLGV